jgi:hypothetical protein
VVTRVRKVEAKDQEMENARILLAASAKQAQAQANFWTAVALLIQVAAFFALIPMVIFFIRLGQLAWQWQP